MNCLELFSGVGGMSTGLANAGFKHVQLIENDPYCVETLNKNGVISPASGRGKLVKAQNVENFGFCEFEDKLDLLAGGPPCQPFSFGGSHRAATDSRNLFPEAVRAVREARPRAFVFENVPGLMRPRFLNYLEYLRLSLTFPSMSPASHEDWEGHLQRLQNHHTYNPAGGDEYRVVIHAVNAADYGIPQKRHRVFLVGIRSDQKSSWSFPEPTHSQAALEQAKLSGDYYERHSIESPEEYSPEVSKEKSFEFERQKKPWVTLRDTLADLPDPEQDQASNDISGHDFKAGARVYKGHTGSHLDQPSKTLKAGVNGVPGGENMLVKDDGSVRYLTIRECARVQTFPDSYVFHPIWSRAMRQLGNAVPVQLSTIIGKSIAHALSN